MTARPTRRVLLEKARSLLKSAGVDDYSLEAELLLQHATGLTASQMFARLTEEATQEEARALGQLVERRAMREPLAYITRQRDFYGRRFYVDQRVLVPRPETELLVELALAFIRNTSSRSPRVADIGVGSGVLAITLALELPGATIDAVDISPHALEVARHNAERHGVAERVTFHQGDLAEPVAGSEFDVIVANLPYVLPESYYEGQPELRHEPHIALLGGPDGLSLIRRLIQQLPRLLASSASIALLEADPIRAGPASELARRQLPDARVHIHDDPAGLERCVEIARVKH
ncbi:MAG: peptide chain release factor N(5)-glutamine methyltransferase [Chloroflexota bacterium]